MTTPNTTTTTTRLRPVARLTVLALLALPLLTLLGCGGGGSQDPMIPVRAWVEHTLSHYRAYQEQGVAMDALAVEVRAGMASVHTGHDTNAAADKTRVQEQEDLAQAREHFEDALHQAPRWEVTNASNPDGVWRFEVTFWFYDLAKLDDVPEDARGEARYQLVSQRDSYLLVVADLDGWKLTDLQSTSGRRRLLALCSPPSIPPISGVEWPRPRW